MKILGKSCSLLAGAALMSLVSSSLVEARVDGSTITLGAAVSLTGKYSTNGKHTKNGYNFAVKRINSMGGVKVGGKSYKLKVKYLSKSLSIPIYQFGVAD